MTFHNDRSPGTQADIRLIFGSAHRPDQIALNPRYIQQVLGELASGVEVPEQDLREGRASPRSRIGGNMARLMQVHSGDAIPTDAFAALHYRGRVAVSPHG